MDQESRLLVKTCLERRSSATEQKINSTGSETDRIQWSSCKDFTADVGKEQINSYIQTWKLRPCWIQTLDFLSSTEEEISTFYHYKARFRPSTAQKPIQGAASIYFVVEVNKNGSQTLPVDVYYVLESKQTVHSAVESGFREQWLLDIIDSKDLVRRLFEMDCQC